MQKYTFDIKLEDGKFWEICQDSRGEYDREVTSFAQFDEMAQGLFWSMTVCGHKQRKFRACSGMTKSILAMLDSVKAELQKDKHAIVLCITPDVAIEFFLG